MNEQKTEDASVPLDCAVGAPNRIWLQWHGDEDPADWPNHPDPIGSDVTWCAEQIYEHDVQYVRYEHLPNANVLALKDEIMRLRRIADAAEIYYRHYMIDEAEDAENCACGEEQHQRAMALRDALKSLRPNTAVSRPQQENKT